MNQEPDNQSLLRPIPVANTRRGFVVEQLREAVLDGVLPPGSQLNEVQLAKQLGVSRGPLREAIRQLVADGLLEYIPYIGTLVPALDVKVVNEIYTLRIALESLAFEQAWPKRTPQFKTDLETRHKALLDAIKDADLKRCIECELALHHTVYEVSEHGLLLNMWQALSGRLHFYLRNHYLAHHRVGPSKAGHKKYIELATGDDLPAILAEVREHMQRGLDKVVELLEARQQTDG